MNTNIIHSDQICFLTKHNVDSSMFLVNNFNNSYHLKSVIKTYFIIFSCCFHFILLNFLQLLVFLIFLYIKFRLEVPPSQERCAMWKSEVLFSSSYVVNLMIFQPFLLQHTQKSIKLHIFFMKLFRKFLTRLVVCKKVQ